MFMHYVELVKNCKGGFLLSVEVTLVLELLLFFW